MRLTRWNVLNDFTHFRFSSRLIMNRRILGFLGIIAAVCMTAAARGQTAQPQGNPPARADSNADVAARQCFYVVAGTTENGLSVSPSNYYYPPINNPASLLHSTPGSCGGDPLDDSPPKFVGAKLTGFDELGLPVASMTLGGFSILGGCDSVAGREVMLDNTVAHGPPEKISFVTGFPLRPAAKVRPVTADEQAQARAFMVRVGGQMGIPNVLAPSIKILDERKEDADDRPKNGLTLSFVDFNHDGLPDLVGTFYLKNLGDYSMLVIARNTGHGFVAEYKKLITRAELYAQTKDMEDYPYGYAPEDYSWYGSFNIGDHDDLIAIQVHDQEWGMIRVQFMQRNAAGRWRAVSVASLDTGCD
jgi:hypothetical protein